MYVCMYACMYACMYVCVGVCMHVCMHVCLLCCDVVCLWLSMSSTVHRPLSGACNLVGYGHISSVFILCFDVLYLLHL